MGINAFAVNSACGAVKLGIPESEKRGSAVQAVPSPLRLTAACSECRYPCSERCCSNGDWMLPCSDRDLIWVSAADCWLFSPDTKA